VIKMVFGFLKRKREEEKLPELTEVPLEFEERTEHTKILIEKINNLGDADHIIRKVRMGNIVIANIKEIKEDKPDELRQAIGRIKTAIANMQGDIAGAGDEWIIATPKTAVIKREGI
jgi:SepF-like predicted cell division protein (DUF552 family)